MNEHIIYKITNTLNDKIYIGKTKRYYGKTKHGINGRFKNHISNALANRDKKGCPKLYNAIRKYGENNFMTEEIESTDADNIDDREVYYIKFYDSINRNVGYNISLGGRGRKVVNVSEETRAKISKAQVGNGNMNIRPYKDKKTGEIIGYRARRREHDKYCEKFFTSKQYTPEENHIKASEFIESVKNNTEDKYVKYNKKNNLPKNISCVYGKINKTKILGYQVSKLLNGKKFHKSFQSKDKDLGELLSEAIKYRDDILKDTK